MKNYKTFDLTVQKDIKKLLEKGVSEGVFPCAATGILKGTGEEKKKIITYCGNASLFPEKKKLRKKTNFDLASLTKPLATTMAILSLIKMKKIELEQTLPSLLEKEIKGVKKKINIKQLLTHCSGFPAHRDYYKILKDIPNNKKKEFIESLLIREKLEYTPDSMMLYSDLGFMLLGLIIEKKSGRTLEDFVHE